MVTNQFLVPVSRTIFQRDNNKQIIFSTDQREESQTRYCESFSENDAVYAAHKLTQQTLAADSSWPNPRHIVPDTPCLLRNTPRSDLYLICSHTLMLNRSSIEEGKSRKNRERGDTCLERNRMVGS